MDMENFWKNGLFLPIACSLFRQMGVELVLEWKRSKRCGHWVSFVYMPLWQSGQWCTKVTPAPPNRLIYSPFFSSSLCFQKREEGESLILAPAQPKLRGNRNIFWKVTELTSKSWNMDRSIRNLYTKKKKKNLTKNLD